MLGYGDSWNSELYTWDRRLLSFLRTVARRPDLAGFVKRIHILPQLLQASDEALEKRRKEGQVRGLLRPSEIELDWLDAIYETPWPQLRESILEDEAFDTLREVAVALNIKRPGRLSTKHLITLLVAALPNLEYCSLFSGPNSDPMAVDSQMMVVRPKILSAAGISQLPLRIINLSVLRTAERRFDLSSNARDLLKVSPCLETLNLHKCYWTRERAAFPSLPRLKNIRITSSRLNEKGLEKILDSSNSLRSFTYEAGFHYGDFGEDMRWDCSDHFELRNAARYLTRHCKTLESVHIDLRHRGGEPATPSTFSFRELTTLKHLFLNLDEFHSHFFDHRCTDNTQLFVHILPSGLNSLHLAGHIKEDLPRLEQGLLGLGQAVIKGQFQSLTEVRWNRNAKLDAEDAVRSLFAYARVRLSYDTLERTRSCFRGGDFSPWVNFRGPYDLPSFSEGELDYL